MAEIREGIQFKKEWKGGGGGSCFYSFLMFYLLVLFSLLYLYFYNYQMHERIMYMCVFSMCANNVFSKCKHPFKTENVDKYQGHKEFLFLFSLGDLNII